METEKMKNSVNYAICHINPCFQVIHDAKLTSENWNDEKVENGPLIHWQGNENQFTKDTVIGSLNGPDEST